MSTTRIPLIYSGRVRRALFLAENKHRGTSRKTHDVPYIMHCVTVAHVLSTAGADDDIICAAYLHDVVEDTDFTLAQIEDQFGGGVARLVADVTKSENVEGLNKKQRSKKTREFFKQAQPTSCSLKAGDVIANVTDLILDQQEKGFQIWESMFGENLETKISHYIKLGQILSQRTDLPVLASVLHERISQLDSLLRQWQIQQSDKV